MTQATPPAMVALIGFGTIGSGVARLLLEQPERIARQAGRPVQLVRIVDRDITKSRNVAVPKELLSTDVNSVIKERGQFLVRAHFLQAVSLYGRSSRLGVNWVTP